MELKETFSPVALKSRAAQSKTTHVSAPAVTTVTMWVLLPQQSWWVLERSRAMAGSLPGCSCQQQLISHCSTAWRCSAHRCVTHLTLDKELQHAWVAPPPKGNPKAWLWPSLTTTTASATTTSAACAALHNLRRVQTNGLGFFSKNKLTPIPSGNPIFIHEPFHLALIPGLQACLREEPALVTEISPAPRKKQQSKDG